MVSLVFFDILQLPHTVISNSEKLTHPTMHCFINRKQGLEPVTLTHWQAGYNTGRPV